MTKAEAIGLNQGDTVLYRGKPHTINSIRVRGIAAPHFRLHGEHASDGLVSWELCSLQVPETTD